MNEFQNAAKLFFIILQMLRYMYIAKMHKMKQKLKKKQTQRVSVSVGPATFRVDDDLIDKSANFAQVTVSKKAAWKQLNPNHQKMGIISKI